MKKQVSIQTSKDTPLAAPKKHISASPSSSQRLNSKIGLPLSLCIALTARVKVKISEVYKTFPCGKGMTSLQVDVETTDLEPRLVGEPAVCTREETGQLRPLQVYRHP